MIKKAVILGAVVIVAGVIALFLIPAPPATAPGDEVNSSASSTTATGASSSLAQSSTSPTKSSPPSIKLTGVKPVVSSNKFIAPLSGDQWVIKENHSIQWNEEALGNGFISLVDAKTGAVVGVISPSLTLHQKTHTWNTQDVLVSRTGGQKKNIEPGEYIIRVTFEVGRKGVIETGKFSVIYPNQKTVSSQIFFIQNYVMSPAKLTVKRGDVIYIRNNDPTPIKILISGSIPITVMAGQLYTFSTASLSAGSYEFYSDQYSGMKATLLVQ